MAVQSILRSAVGASRRLALLLTCLAVPPIASVSAQSVWSVAATADVSLGTADGAFSGDFDRIIAAARLQDGRIVVADALDRLVVFDSLGGYAATITRGGQGLGAFMSVRWLAALRGDSLLAWDGYAFRVSIFDSRLDSPTSVDLVGSRPPEIAGRFADGTWLAWQFVDSGIGGGLFTYRINVFRLDREGQFSNDIATVTGGEGYDGGEGARFLSAPSFYTGSPLKRTALVAGPDRVYVATGSTMEISMYGVDGSELGSFSQPATALQTTAEDIDRFSWSVQMANILRGNLPSGHTLPAISQMLLDDLGNLWVGRFNREVDEATEWLVFDGAGRMIATTSLPAGLTPTHFGLDFVVGRWKDEAEVESVRVHRLERR
jgi:hypothetical protein